MRESAPTPLIRQKTVIATVSALATALIVAVPASAVHASSAPIVGRWARVTICQELVSALKKAGLRRLAPAVLPGNGLVPGSPKQLAQETHICKCATPRLHSHFFNRQGEFGSLDWRGQQVDDGPFQIIDGHTIHIGAPGGVAGTFHYRSLDGDRLVLQPVIPLRSSVRPSPTPPLQRSGVDGGGGLSRSHVEARSLQWLVLARRDRRRRIRCGRSPFSQHSRCSPHY